MAREICLLMVLGGGLVACSSDDGGAGSDAAPSGLDAAAVDSGMVVGEPDAAAGQWTTLVTGSWEMAPGEQGYWCARLTVTEDMYITGLRAVAPAGTHHTVLTISDGAGADGEGSCAPNTLSDEMLFASGVGTDQLRFPAGVAVKVKAGRQLLLNLHLFNVNDATIAGVSGTEVLVMPADEVEHEAEMVFGGTFNINLPPMQAASASGRCTFGGDSTVMMLWPHMHQHGNHMTVTHEHSGGDDVLLDTDYSFYEQVNYSIEPLLVRTGDKISVGCDYFNSTNGVVNFGDRSQDEMCFIGLYRYPALGTGLFCTN